MVDTQKSSEGPASLEKEIAGAIAACREELGLSQADLADKLDVTDNTIGNYESGKPGNRYNAIRLMRWLADHAPSGREEMARLLGIELSPEQSDPHLGRWLDLTRRAHQLAASGTTEGKLMRGLLDNLETAVMLAEKGGGGTDTN